MTAIRISLAAAALLGFGVQARAMPIQSEALASDTGQIIQVYNGCGVYGHRGPWGGCRPGGQAGGYNRASCPWGYHVGPHGHYCWRN
jgi:hypothetical protein